MRRRTRAIILPFARIPPATSSLPLDVWIQTGSCILVAFSEILAFGSCRESAKIAKTGLEYAFTTAPRNKRSLVMSVFLFTSSMSTALGEAFVSLSTDLLLVWSYGSTGMGVLSMVAGILF
ncbi:hypothetical protein FB451DRAFT_1212907 [Mycena latifolia]|nr:hypothetical protein FB451DRAFT_1212907 [Mycena latifolia]